MHERSRRIFDLSISLLGITIFLISLQKVSWTAVWQGIGSIGYGNMVVVTLLMTLPILATAWVMDALLYTIGKKVAFRKLLEYQTVRFFYNIVSPGPSVGGDLFEARLLQKEAGGNYSEYLGLVFFERYLRIILSILVIFPCMIAFFTYATGTLTGVTIVSMWLLMAVLVGMTILYQQQKKPLQFLLGRVLGSRRKASLARFEDYYLLFFKLPRAVRRRVVLRSFAVIAAFLLRITFVFYLCTGQVNWWAIGFIYLVENLVTLFPTPGSIGFFEGAQVYAFQLLGLGADAGVLFCFAYRAGQLVISIFSLPVIARARLLLNRRKAD